MEYRRLLVGTTVATALTALMGVLTATAGAGLTCDARWPLCDGAVFGLFPATFMSFIEWSHRLVAMVAGLLIVAATVAAWRGRRSRRVRLATLGALLLTPVQVAFGAFTVLVREFVFGYSLVVLTLHFSLAAAILGLLVAATAWTYADADRLDADRLDRLGLAALAGFPVLALFAPRLVVTFGEAVQFGYYAVGFATYAALLVVAIGARERAVPAAAASAGVGVLLVVALLVFSRQSYGTLGSLFVVALAAAGFLAALVAVRRLRRLAPLPGRAGSPVD